MDASERRKALREFRDTTPETGATTSRAVTVRAPRRSALLFIQGAYRLIGWILIVGGVLGTGVALREVFTAGSLFAFAALLPLLGGALGGITCFGIAEVIDLFLSIEASVSRIASKP